MALGVQLSDLRNLFSSKVQAIIFVAYMGLFISQGMLVTATKTQSNSYAYDPVCAVLLAEALKLIFSMAMSLKHSGSSFCFRDFVQHKKLLILYFVPSLLYCLYNNLTFVNLIEYDPTSYFMLLQLRVVVTGIIYQVIFKKMLSKQQWLSLVLQTLGCIITQASHQHIGLKNLSSFLSIHLFWILVQILSSCFAGVYNEYLLKGRGGDDAPLMLQNTYMYMDSIICNIAALIFTGQLTSAISMSNLRGLTNPLVIMVVVNNAAIGIVTSMFLRSLNVVLKSFASALELAITGLLTWLLFGIDLGPATIVAIILIVYSTLLYAKNPVKDTPPNQPLIPMTTGDN